jgi:hypothetical protein
MTEMHIDKLTLRLAGRDKHAATRLAQRMAERLQSLVCSEEWEQQGDQIRVQIPDAPAATTDRLAEQAATEVVRKLRRS